MEVSKMVSFEKLKWRCREHPNVQCDFIYLGGEAKNRVVCLNCTQNQQIPVSNLISMSQVLSSNEHEILEAYPPLKDQKLSSKLRNTNQQQLFEAIEGYFKKLREDFEEEVQAAQQRAKQSLIKQERVHQELLEGYMNIAEIEKLKQLILSEKESAEKDLDDFINEKLNKAEENRKTMEDLLDQYEAKQQFSLDEPNRIAQEIIQSLKSIKLFQESLQLSQVTLIKSTFNNSQKLEITKDNNSIYQIKKLGAQNGYWDQAFIDPIISPLLKYILHIELEQKPGNNQNTFFFGLVKDEGKDNNQAFFQSMCYYDHSNSYGITNYIKGSPMQKGYNETGKHSFEVRIHLNQRFLRVACLPDYSSISELDDPNKIDPKIAYRFFLAMAYQGDIMRITNIKTVSKFDEKM